MSRVAVFLKDNIIQDLKKLSKHNGKSLSSTISELVDIGYQIKQHQNDNAQTFSKDKLTDLSNKHTEYLLKTMAIATDIYRCIRNDKSKYEETTVNDVLNRIDANTSDFIKNYTNTT